MSFYHQPYSWAQSIYCASQFLSTSFISINSFIKEMRVLVEQIWCVNFADDVYERLLQFICIHFTLCSLYVGYIWFFSCMYEIHMVFSTYEILCNETPPRDLLYKNIAPFNISFILLFKKLFILEDVFILLCWYVCLRFNPVWHYIQTCVYRFKS